MIILDDAIKAATFALENEYNFDEDDYSEVAKIAIDAARPIIEAEVRAKMTEEIALESKKLRLQSMSNPLTTSLAVPANTSRS